MFFGTSFIKEDVNPSWLPFLYKKTGTLALAQSGLTACRQAGRQADKMLLHLENFKIIYCTKHWKLLTSRKVQCHYNGTNTFQVFFRVICILMWF